MLVRRRITNLVNAFLRYPITGVITYDGIDVKLIERFSSSFTWYRASEYPSSREPRWKLLLWSCRATREEILEAARGANVGSTLCNADNAVWHCCLQMTVAGLSINVGLSHTCACCPCQCTGSYPWRGDILYWLSYRKMVQKGCRLMEGRTVFVIAHRLSTIVNSTDVIMVMDHGRIINVVMTQPYGTGGTYADSIPVVLEIWLRLKKLRLNLSFSLWKRFLWDFSWKIMNLIS